MSLTLICRQRRNTAQQADAFISTRQEWVAAIPTTLASTHRQITVDEAEDDVGADEDAGAADSGTAVHRDRTGAVHRPHVADEADQLLGAVGHTVVGPVCELQVMDQMSLT